MTHVASMPHDLSEVTPAIILDRAKAQEPSALERMHSLLCRYGLQDAANALSDEADLQTQLLTQAMASMHSPEARGEVADLVTQAAAVAANIAYARGRADQKAEDEPRLKDQRDTWVKVYPDTLPVHEKEMDLYIEPNREVQRGSYDLEEKQFRSIWTGRVFERDEIVTHYRIGVRPPAGGSHEA